MTTESLCSIGQHKRRQTIESDTNRGEEEEEEEKQKGKEKEEEDGRDRRRRRRRGRRQRSGGGGKTKVGSATGRRRQQQHQVDNIKGTTLGNYRQANDTGETTTTTTTTGAGRLGLVCDNSINRLQQQQQQQHHSCGENCCGNSGTVEASLFDNSNSNSWLIDSRSILTNKTRLKRFWEHKMEMEFKLRQRQQNSDHNNNNSQLGKVPTTAARRSSSSSSNGQPKNNHQKLVVTFDENNNNSSNCGGGGGNSGILAMDEQIFGEGARNKKKEEEEQGGNNDRDCQQQFSEEDEEWRSLSPNVEPTNGTFKMASSSCTSASMINQQQLKQQQQQQNQPVKQVSASLVCEKLREYRDNCNATASQRQLTTASKPEEEPMTPEGQRKVAESGEASKKTSQQVPTMNDDIITNTCSSSSNNHLNGHHLDTENQLMSIDPTLCHSGGGETNQATKPNATCSEQQPKQRQPVANEEQIACQQSAAAAAATEEQTANEEFSSSSSSFGPMSISIAMTTTNGCDVSHSSQSLREPEVDGGNDDTSDGEEEEESNSAQSGSVLTVITAKNLELELKADGGGRQSEPPLSINESTSDEAASSNILQDTTTTNSSISQQPNSLVSSDTSEFTMGNEPQSSSLADNEQGEGSLVDDDDGGSNIGVAFESLHFDSEIKSSKHERVDEMLLGPPPPAAKHRSMVPKFNANEVKSVCNFITAAISDATRQVESYMRNDDSQPPEVAAAIGCEAKLSRVGAGSIQRATFVQQSDLSFHQGSSSPPKKRIDRKSAPVVAAKDTGIDDNNNNNINGDDDGCDAQNDEDPNDEEDDDEVPKADLSSIFEANVRREIQRFETNSLLVKKSKVNGVNCNGGGGGGKLMNKNGLTEWRIAEEIRLFNEREMELKRRFGRDAVVVGASSLEDSPDGSSNGNTSSCSKTSSLNGRPAANQQVANGVSRQHPVVEPKPRQNQQQAIVRFGKTLQLPKPVATTGSCHKPLDAANPNHNPPPIVSQKSIKLSTVANGGLGSQNGLHHHHHHHHHNQPTTSISMHKFIASGGKRFVFTSSGSAAGGSSSSINSSHQQQQKQLTKSMSNLSISESVKSEPLPLPAKTVDYKAVDSLKCKETPNVRPGLTRKVIESFLRMNNKSSSSSLQSNHKSATAAPLATSTTANAEGSGNVASGCQSLLMNSQQAAPTNHRPTWSNNNQQQNQSCPVGSKQQSGSSLCPSQPSIATTIPSSSNQPQSAEHKIQEELREMRAREAELRSQRLMRKTPNQSPPNNLDNNSHLIECSSSATDFDGGDHNGRDRLGIEERDNDADRMLAAAAAADRLCSSSESLYPIKQTIDSFRKLNNSLNQGSNTILSHMPQQNMRKSQTKGKNELQHHQGDNDDYDSRVGGERRKISMIEKWENRRLQ